MLTVEYRVPQPSDAMSCDRLLDTFGLATPLFCCTSYLLHSLLIDCHSHPNSSAASLKAPRFRTPLLLPESRCRMTAALSKSVRFFRFGTVGVWLADDMPQFMMGRLLGGGLKLGW